MAVERDAPQRLADGLAGMRDGSSVQTLATLPHQYETWLWTGHTVPNGDPPEPYAPDTGLCCALIHPPVLAGDEFRQLRFEDHVVNFLGVYPLYQDEMELKLEAGAEELERRFETAEITELLQPGRPSVA